MAEVPLEGRRLGLVLGTSAGGVGRHLRAEAASAIAQGAAVVVAGPDATERAFDFSAVGCDFRSVEIAAGPRPLADLRAGWSLRHAMQDREVVHAHGLRAGLLAGFATRRGVPLVVTWHNAVLAKGALRRLYAVLERRTARRADVTLCVSGDLVARAQALGGRDVRLSPVGSSQPTRTSRSVVDIRRELQAPEGTALVLAIGRLDPQKGFDVLVRAASLLRARTPPPVLVVAGDGPSRVPLTVLIDELDAPVRLLGWRDDTGDLLAAADLVVMPSRWEGSPLAAHETLLAGRPLVATSVGGLPELLGDGAALLVASDDPGSLAGAIDDLLDHPDRRMSLALAGQRRGANWPDSAAAAHAATAVVASMLGSRQ